MRPLQTRTNTGHKPWSTERLAYRVISEAAPCALLSVCVGRDRVSHPVTHVRTSSQRSRGMPPEGLNLMRPRARVTAGPRQLLRVGGLSAEKRSAPAAFRHSLDAFPVVPPAVDEHDFACRWQSFDVALRLSLTSLGAPRQGADARMPRVELLRGVFDRAALAGSVTAFDDDEHPRSGRDHHCCIATDSTCVAPRVALWLLSP